jgi:hypothetical protein
METVSVDIPRLSGFLLMIENILVIAMHCYLTYLVVVTSLQNKQAMSYIAAIFMDLVLKEMVVASYVHGVNHLMVMTIAFHTQINLVMISHLMLLVSTCSLTIRMKASQ